ncbi:hypothetical protein K875_05649 [Mycobacterium [tuberculosis] TKK-01-0051]|uniref:DNA 3'-5' helicase n=1 Tax=Mycobacterium [tuberculosis] TKK-01-0051 TaxID=1324261 RepID=A0A051TLC5_9MYCO|nr:ATP-dependent helicase [Mycobacterium colombiense]KBZ57131.1 hypothetical protein K875_05649 [Mycobacterium [tuberculosis] TKK-01-0051]
MTASTPPTWQPQGIDDLEPAAWDALRHNGNACVTAGPGGGKTEFLAQRASYLLETGICRSPRRILSISFKRDSAANLERRVDSRTPEHADRFVSMTFDAFTKSIVDRFRELLPPYWKLQGSYSIRYPTSKEVRNFLDTLSESADDEHRSALYRVPRNTFLSTVVGSYNLPASFSEPTSAGEYAIQQWWKQTYLGREDPAIDFITINRLAELAIRSNPGLRTALRWTYPYVFIDEFQDTTFAQYSFLRSVFDDAALACQITVVGDNKQRIMGWAGALSDAFAEFSSDFTTARFELTWNFRSSDALVALQHRVAQILDPSARLAISKALADIDDQPAQLWSFRDQRHEAQTIAAWIAADIEASGRQSAQYALVARQTVAEFENDLRSALATHGLQLRNDDAEVGELKLQILLKDRLSRLLHGLLKLAAPRTGRAGLPTVWRDVSSTIARLRLGEVSDVTATAVDDELSALLRPLRTWLHDTPCGPDAVDVLIEQLIKLLDEVTLGNYTTICDRTEDSSISQAAIARRLKDVITPGYGWWDAAQQYDAPNAVPLLTIHRSKGLEYHTVFFLGLEDQQWWAHSQDVAASISTFFVGLSRAAQRVVFTRCNARGDTDNITEFYDILDDAGISIQTFS